METLKLKNGQTINGHALESDGRLFLYMYNITLTDAFNALIDPNNTKVIKEDRYGIETTYRGYNHLRAISEEMGGMICTTLTK